MPTIWPAGNAEADVVKNRRSIDAIAEGHMLEHDIAANRRQGGLTGIV